MTTINWILAVAAVGAGAVAVTKHGTGNILAGLKRLQSDTASQVADQAQGAADLVNVGIESAKDVARKLWTPPKSAAEFLPWIDAATDSYNLPPLLLARVLWQESHYRPDIISGRTKSHAGATGIAQFLPSTAADLGIDPNNPREAIPAAARYLRDLYVKFGTWEKAIAAYNWGQGNVARHWNGVDNAPKETQAYVAGVLGDIGLI